MKSLRHFQTSTHSSPINGILEFRMERLIKKIICLTLIGLGIASFALAQSPGRQVVNQSIQWISVNSNIKLNKKYGLTADGQFRFAEYDNMQHMVRAGFEYYVSKKLSVVPIGYAYIQNYIYGKQPAAFVNNERRIWQQVAYKHSVSRVSVSHRLRFEERFIGVHTKDVNDQVINEGFANKQFRVRYRLMANIPLSHSKMGPKTYYLSIWDEVFVSHGKSVTYNDPDQNRIFVGPGYQVSKDLAFQGGFFAQTLIKSNGAKQENNVGFLLQMNYNFDFSK